METLPHPHILLDIPAKIKKKSSVMIQRILGKKRRLPQILMMRTQMMKIQMILTRKKPKQIRRIISVQNVTKASQEKNTLAITATISLGFVITVDQT